MSSKDNKWNGNNYPVKTIRLKKSNRRIFTRRSDKIKQIIKQIKQKRMDRFRGVTVREVVYINASTGENVHAEYSINPSSDFDGLYEIQEYMMTEKDFYNLEYAKEYIANAEERRSFIENQEIKKTNTRVMYATIDYEIIQQLRMNRGLDKYEDARNHFKKLVEHQRVKKRILASGDKKAKYIYEEGKQKNPRVYGYIGGIKHTIGGNRRIYDLREKRAKEVNKSVLNSLLTGEIKRKEYEEEAR